ncbi:type II secretion system minor pseudopilin GspK [Marinimicrobium agarilyticum]|uniref:type II secretion system minor pseudopilin GspK n=1 Tax=Marinimicrobium agarilyticum TaxID=306546 RepID=UPI0004231AF6|nr:type II secretion system minor pseudopilin GspK [Marinimicrobium agarilyticum]
MGPGRETGAVLIMALLIVSVVAGLAVKFTADYQLGLAKAESRWLGAQARSHLLAAESIAEFVLSEEMDPDPAVDYYEEGWGVTQDIQLDGVWVTVAITDAQSYIDLNSLGKDLPDDKAITDPTRYSAAQRRFIRLLQTFEDQIPLNPAEAAAVVEAIVDWMDTDNTPSGFAGAEADYYIGLETEYQPANQPFSSVDELRLVRHVSEDLMQLIRPYLVVLPGQGQATVPMNVNTMPMRLLRTINGENDLTPLDPMQVEMLLQDKAQQGFYQDVNTFRGSQIWQSLGVTPNTSDFGVTTSYFMLEAEATINEQRRAMRSILKRQNDTVESIQRKDIYEITRFPETAMPANSQSATTQQ